LPELVGGIESDDGLELVDVRTSLSGRSAWVEVDATDEIAVVEDVGVEDLEVENVEVVDFDEPVEV
jgi:hypothetical protein